MDLKKLLGLYNPIQLTVFDIYVRFYGHYFTMANPNDIIEVSNRSALEFKLSDRIATFLVR